jgi:hypothetical protein
MPYDLFTLEARESICCYFEPMLRDPLDVIVPFEEVETDKVGYAYRFVTNAGKKVTDAHVWSCLVAEIIQGLGGDGSLSSNSMILDILCVEEATSDEPEVRFIEPFFTDLGRKLLCEHHGIKHLGLRAEPYPRDFDLWSMFASNVARAVREHDAGPLGKFLVGPYAMLEAKKQQEQKATP